MKSRRPTSTHVAPFESYHSTLLSPRKTVTPFSGFHLPCSYFTLYPLNTFVMPLLATLKFMATDLTEVQSVYRHSKETMQVNI